MRILYITSPTEDYLSDALLHGFRSQYDVNCVDYPKNEVLYDNSLVASKAQIRGKGFTLYTGLLNDTPIDRFKIFARIQSKEFDLVVFSDIWRQFGWFVQLRPYLDGSNCIILDGADTPYPYPAAGRWWRRYYYWSLPVAHRDFLYFKREWTSKTTFSLTHRYISRLAFVRQHRNLRQISFSIPAEKIISSPTSKTKDFPLHIVDPEVAQHIPGSNIQYAFTSEHAYYEDLQSSRFGITTRRAGWDCLRHYEIAANGAVPCFRRLSDKPATCAPHGMNETNSISYANWDDLRVRISHLTDQKYAALQKGSIQWARDNTTSRAAISIVHQWQIWKQNTSR